MDENEISTFSTLPTTATTSTTATKTNFKFNLNLNLGWWLDFMSFDHKTLTHLSSKPITSWKDRKNENSLTKQKKHKKMK